jgi:hypothetical protein
MHSFVIHLQSSRRLEDSCSPARMERVLGNHWLWLREIVKEGVTISSHPIQNPLLLVTEPQPCDIIINDITIICSSH